MPNKVYMPDEEHRGGGLVFHVTWDNLEEYLRGEAPRQHNGKPALVSGEVCDFVVRKTGVDVYVKHA